MMPSFPRTGRSWWCRPLFSHTVSPYHIQQNSLGMWAYSFPQQTGSPYSNKGSCLNLNIKMMVNKELRPYNSKPWIYLKFSLVGCNRHGFLLFTLNSRLSPRDMRKVRGWVSGRVIPRKLEEGPCLTQSSYEKDSVVPHFFRTRSETVSHLSASIHKAESGWAVFKHSQAMGMCMPLLTTWGTTVNISQK